MYLHVKRNLLDAGSTWRMSLTRSFQGATQRHRRLRGVETGSSCGSVEPGLHFVKCCHFVILSHVDTASGNDNYFVNVSRMDRTSSIGLHVALGGPRGATTNFWQVNNRPTS